jgi:CYTH domain-containing protein
VSDFEVERKWLVEHVPEEILAYPAQRIEQGYLVIGAEGSEVRLRRREQSCFLTVKSGRGVVRRELEVELSDEQFDALWPATEGRRIEKTRRVIDVQTKASGGLRIELDEYAGELTGLWVAEVEFPGRQTAGSFTAPGWFAAEVSDRDDYKNRSLALQGRPEPKE